MKICTPELISSSHGDNVLLECLLSHVTIEIEDASAGPDCFQICSLSCYIPRAEYSFTAQE